MRAAHCKGCGQDIEIPAGIQHGETFAGPNGAGLSLRASETDGQWSVTEVKKASCAVGEEVIILPESVQPGDIIECHGVKQQVTYEFGAYALVKVDGWAGCGASWEGSSGPLGPSFLPSVACFRS